MQRRANLLPSSLFLRLPFVKKEKRKKGKKKNYCTRRQEDLYLKFLGNEFRRDSLFVPKGGGVGEVESFLILENNRGIIRRMIRKPSTAFNASTLAVIHLAGYAISEFHPHTWHWFTLVTTDGSRWSTFEGSSPFSPFESLGRRVPNLVPKLSPNYLEKRGISFEDPCKRVYPTRLPPRRDSSTFRQTDYLPPRAFPKYTCSSSRNRKKKSRKKEKNNMTLL